MALLTIKQAMAELGYRSPTSIENLRDDGHLRIVRLPRRPGSSRAKGPPRVPSEDVERIKAESLAAADAESPAPAPQPSTVTPPERSVKSRPSPRRPAAKRPKGLVHFE